MDDFLHNLRTGKDKRYDRTRKNYDQSQYRSLDRQNGMDRRKKGVYKQSTSDQAYLTIAKVLPGLKTLLESIAEDRRQLTYLEERKADALEQIAACLKKMTGQNDVGTSAETETSKVETQDDIFLKADEEGLKVKTFGDPAEIIKKLREEGLSFEKIAQHLDADGVPTPSGRGKWRGQAVSKLLKE